MTQNNEAQQHIVDHQVLPGATLQQLRVKKGLAADQVRNQIGLTVSLFDALEADDYQRLPAPVYVKGYLRCYAESLGLRAAPILANYQHLLEEQERRDNPQPTPSNNRPRFAISIASILMLLTTSLVFGAILTDNQQVDTVSDSPTDVVASENPFPAAQVAGDDVLHMEFATDSWVEVVDGNDHILTVSLQRAGSVLDLEGMPPYKISLGYGPGVMMSYNNEPIALKYDSETFAVDMTLGL